MPISLKQLRKGIADLLYPPLCVVCAENVQQSHSLCARCFRKIQFITQPFCAKCSEPFPQRIKSDVCDQNCLNKVHSYIECRAAFLYDDFSSCIIHKLKFQDKSYISNLLVKWMIQAGREIIKRSNIITAVPIYKKNYT